MAVSVASWLAGWLLADWVVVCYNQYCINERIEHKLLSLTCKALTTAQPTYLHSLISVQPPRATRSSSVVTLFDHLLQSPIAHFAMHHLIKINNSTAVFVCTESDDKWTDVNAYRSTCQFYAR